MGDQKFVGPADTLSYTIRFENAPTATAPASVVTLTQTLDPDLDASSVRFVGAGFADVNLTFNNARFVNTRYDDRAVSGLFVDLEGFADIPARTIHWSFTSIDPATGEAPADASLGFLAINNAAHAGEGYLTYSAKPASGAGKNASIDAVASIVFDTNAAIPTPPIFNTIDSVAPSPGSLGFATIAGQADSKALVLLGARPVTLKWAAGTDTGSGVANHTLQVSSDGGTSFTDVVTNTTAASATFSPDVGTRYKFRLLATDRVGNQTSPLLGSLVDLYVTGSSNAILRRNGDNIEAAVGDAAPAFLTRLASDTTSIDFLGTDAAANSLGIHRSAGGAFSTPVRFFGGQAVPVAPSGTPSPSPVDTVTITGLTVEDASIKFSGYQAIRAILGTASLDVIGAESLSLTSAKSLLLQTAGGDDFASINGNGAVANFNSSGPSAGTAVAFSSVPAVTVDLGFGDSAASQNSFALSTAINATGLKSVTVVGGAGSDTFSMFGNSSTALPVAGGGFSFTGNGGTDTIRAEGNANWTLTNSLITSSLGHRVALATVESADLTGGAGNNILDASLFTGTTVLQGGLGNDIIKGGRGRDTIREYGDRATNFTLTNTRLTGLGTDTLSGIEDADFVGGSGNNTFDLSLFTGTATVDCYAGGTDTVKGGKGITTISAADYGATIHNFTLTSTRLTHTSGVVNFTSVEKVELFGGTSANTFNVSTYTGSTTLHGGGGTDTVVATRDAGFTLSDTVLSITGGGTHTLDGIRAARLTGGAGANTFTIGAWTGQATLNGSTGTDTLVASGDFNFTLGAASLSISSGALVAFTAIEKARLTGGNSANTIDASLFAGSVILFGLDGNDILRGARRASVLVGGNGADSLAAGTGRSILIGGAGADAIAGGTADDLVIHGSTRYDANTAALDALLAEWSRTTATYAQRVSRLRTGVGGLNGANKLTGAVTDDLATDSMFGGAGQDWFFARVTAPADILSDKASNENLN
ncbi:MAG: beta strand repeat-containing protein [Planctomycetota bacterium]